MEQLSFDFVPVKSLFDEKDAASVDGMLESVLMNAHSHELYGPNLVHAELLKSRKQISLKAKSNRPVYITIGKNGMKMTFPAKYLYLFEGTSVKNPIPNKDGDLECILTYSDFLTLGEPITYILIDVLTTSCGNGFGCCHLFKNCSDAGKCLQSNKLFALRCYYKKNLDAGKVFYGAHPTAGANAEHLQ